MRVHQTLVWLCDEPQHSFTFNGIFRQGWPGLASFFLLPRLLTLGRVARFLERTIFIGGMAGFVAFGGLPIPSLATKAELAFMVNAIALIAGLATQAVLKTLEYLVGGFGRAFPTAGGGNIDLKRYSGNVDLKRYGPKGK